MKIRVFLLCSITILLFTACGKDPVSINPEYIQKIVINAFLYPGQKVDKIRVNRNWPLNVMVEYEKLVINDAYVFITDIINNPDIPYRLAFNTDSNYYYYDGNDFIVQYGGEYKMDVSARIDGKELAASSITEVPLEGFKIIDSLSTDSIYFFNTIYTNGYHNPVVTFQRSRDTDFYVFSIAALDASLETFIYDHPWLAGEIKEKDLIENFNNFKFSHECIFNTPLDGGITSFEILKYHTWFYGRYRLIAYAGDKNYKDYYLTHADVQEMDGNFHEPVLHVDGDGVGVFGSVIADTLYYEVLRK
jgi:hypothetical protein